MKIKDGFMLREIVDSWVVLPIGQRVVEFNSLMTLNESGVLLWKKLENETSKEDLLATILNEYEIDEVTAKEDVEEFLAELRSKGFFES